ncbi:permease-like cell division protein FtsX [Sulfurivermis fontis]|uniref:permease-like cell division protein FtsX n=1 Tax=Sulfurivermis fontis TaxID=1972068 RepID=UPI001E396CFF|nr:permease-like cell division protein FtsX [Sulfurivermis fontis]
MAETTRTPNAPEGARVVKMGAGALLRSWLLRHVQTFFYTLGQIWRRPFNALLTAAVIGIALALPAGLHVLLGNAQQVARGWDGATQVSLFLKRSVSEQRAEALARELEALPEIGSVRYISREQALEEFKSLSGFGDVLQVLEDNPLPAVLVLFPKVEQAQGPEALEQLLTQLRARPEVDLAQLDMQWVKRIYAMMDIVSRGVWVLGSLLGLAVLLVVGNTIRLAIQNRRDEIVIIKLIGGTDAFIRRPFLYTGFWYGLFGGLIALGMIQVSLLFLAGPVAGLAGLYGSDFRLHGLDLLTALALFSGGCLLGLLGSWLAVGRHLREIEPT